MRHYLLQRAGLGLLVLWAAFTLSFVLLQVLPGDAVLIKFQNPDLGLSPQQIAEMRQAYGADSPLWQQYLHTLAAMLHGDFGYSVQAGVPVNELLTSNLPGTLRLALCGFLLATLLAFVLAALSRLPALRFLRNLLQSLPALFISVPTFWLGIALIQLFSFQLRWIPVINPSPWQGLILPIITVAVPISAPLAQILLRSIDEVSTRPFVAVARAKGASEHYVLWRHILRNAMLPVVTVIGLQVGTLLAGAILTETIFSWPGLGRWLIEALQRRDYPVVQGGVLLTAVLIIVVNLLVDLLYGVVNPRIRHKK
ncbi:MAG TPA: peptide ABC transporter permease [Pantoea sp.]|nr:peptide ABC transporter permease [Pantoea sp.]